VAALFCGKAVALQVKDAQQMIDAYEAAKQQHPGLVFSASSCSDVCFWRKIKEITRRAATWGNWNGFTWR